MLKNTDFLIMGFSIFEFLCHIHMLFIQKIYFLSLSDPRYQIPHGHEEKFILREWPSQAKGPTGPTPWGRGGGDLPGGAAPAWL